MLDEYEQQLRDDVEKYGWSAICVDDDAEGPGFVYSIGLMHTLNHPEIIVLGLPRNTMHGMITAMVADIHNGRSFAPPGLYNDIVAHYACKICRVDPRWHTRYVGYAMWHRRHVGKVGTLEVVQCVWPDKQGRFPDERDCHPSFISRQPVLE